MGGGPRPGDDGSENTLVVIDFVEDGDGTLVKLTHSGFANGEFRDLHVHGWQGVLANRAPRLSVALHVPMASALNECRRRRTSD